MGLTFRNVTLAILICLFFVIGFFFAARCGFERIDRDLFRKEKLALQRIIKYFPFTRESSLKEWEAKMLKGKVVYTIEKGESLSYVSAKSRNAASALYYRIAIDIERRPVITWKWRVDKFPERSLPETIYDKEEEDFAARVYVMFPAAFFTRSKVIEYIWAETLPKGTSGASGYSKNIKVLVLETGKSPEWRAEKRNVFDDYVKLFGEEPRLDIGAIAFMTDSDSTTTSAQAAYDEIQIGYE